MKRVFKVISGLMLLTVLGISLSLFDKEEVMATGYYELYTPSSSGDHTVTVWADGNGRATADHDTTSSDAIIRLNAEADPGNEFVEWTKRDTDDINIINSESATGAYFRMIDADVEVTAHFRAITPAAPTASSGGGKSEPKEPEEPDPKTTQGYFFATVTDQVNTMLARLLASANDPAALAGLKAKGITIDAGVWMSFNKDTCVAIDKLIKQGVPIKINYLYRGKTKTIYIPSGFPYTLEEMCDENGYAGFEYIYASVINGKPIEKNKPETAHNTVMGAEVGMAALSAGNDFVRQATEGLGMASNVGADGISSFAGLGGGSVRKETG